MSTTVSSDFDGLDVRGRDGEKLGDVNGFIVDLASGRLLYVVVDSGGWFRSRRFLAPIGHAVIDLARRALTLDITRERLEQYPEFEEGRFGEFSDDDLRAFEARTAQACCPEEPPEDADDVGLRHAASLSATGLVEGRSVHLRAAQTRRVAGAPGIWRLR